MIYVYLTVENKIQNVTANSKKTFIRLPAF